MTRLALVYVEIDVPRCGLDYGETNWAGTCPAVLGVDSETKCHRSLGTCPVLPSFVDDPVTLRFSKPTAYLPKDIEAIPSLRSADLTPTTISLAEDLGERAVLTLVFDDHRTPDTGPQLAGDPYVTERGYDPYRRGSFWAKFRARNPYLRGVDIRLIRGFVGQTLEEMETRHYVVESIDGPAPDGTFKIIAQDVLKLFDDERAIAPALSSGVLAAPIDDNDTTVSLSPTGIGIEYPASGYLNVGGSELVAFTRSADVLTLTRGALNTVGVEHAAGERAQVVLAIVAQDPADIIETLAVDYAGIDPSFIPIDAWQAETDAYLGTVYTRYIVEPTGIRELIAELVLEAALILWWDDLTRTIKLQVLRTIATDAATYDADNMLKGSFSVREQPEKRVSMCRVYHGLRNPLLPPDDPQNYSYVQSYIDTESASLYGSLALKDIYARWITASGVAAAARVAALQVARFKDPPRRFTWGLLRGQADAQLGQGSQILNWALQDATGAEVLVPVQTTRLGQTDDSLAIEAEEVRFAGFDIPSADNTNRVVIFDLDQTNANLRTKHDTVYQAPTDADVDNGVNLRVYINAGVELGSTSVGRASLDIGDWPDDFPIAIVVRGRIQAKGGRGGNGCYWNQTPTAGQAGGPAIYTRHPITLDNTDGEIFGGGGGGGGGHEWGGFFSRRWSGGGGGGAGTEGGDGGITGGTAEFGDPGTPDAGGEGGTDDTGTGPPLGYNGGNGGGPGLPGDQGARGGAPGGAAGPAIDGDSYVTYTAVGDLRGGLIN